MEHLTKALALLSRTAQSAQELLRDKELRNKGLQTVATGVQVRIQSLQNGIAQRVGQLSERVQDRQRQLGALLASLEERLHSSQRAWQLQASRRLKVDVQFGRQLIAEAPQEVRARLWYVLLENPHLAAPLKCQQPGPVPNQQSYNDDDEAGSRGAAADRTAASVGTSGAGGGGESSSRSASRLASMAATALGFGRADRSNGAAAGGGCSAHGGSVHGGSMSPPPSSARRDRSSGAGAAAPDSAGPQAQAEGQGQAQAQGLAGPQSPASSPAAPFLGRTSRADAAPSGGGPDPFSGSEMEGWELVGGMVGPLAADAGLGGLAGGAGSAALAAAHPEAVRIIMELLEALGPVPLDESGSDPLLVAQQAVLEAMLQVPWEPGVGLPPQTAPDSRFAMLNEMTAGQEEVDDSILRDIHRTFPEHPYFGMEAGQRALFRVLKAYSLHDLEVAYCQGMAFMAGVLLMYVPEEMAFRLFCRLMDPEGPNLRRYYVPGLEPLKAELATFELLLTWRLPDLAAHLTAFGLPPVLYVSQWLMTLFATPFPPPFCARIIDVLLQDGHDRLLLRCSYAVMEALESELLWRHDFEALITYLKMEPVSWGLTKQRAIMERALTSPITDTEIDVARDMVASRQLLTASAEGGVAGEAAGADAVSAGQDPHGGAAGTAPTLPMPTALSFEHEVEAALAAAAAALTAGEDAGDGGNAQVASGGVGAAPRRGAACNGVPDMISLHDDEQPAAWPRPVGPSRAHGPARDAARDTAASSRGDSRGGTTDGLVADSRGAAGPPPSLLDLDLHLAAAAQTHRCKPDPELEYGEYGEMLLDAGLLLPELGAAGEAPGASATPGGGGEAGLDMQGLGGGAGGAAAAMGMVQQALPSASGAAGAGPAALRSKPQAGDLLLD